MRIFHVLVVAALAGGIVACGSSATIPSSPTPSAQTAGPSTSTNPLGTATGTSAAVAGTWVGVASDTSGVTTGTCMGIPGAGTGNMTWNITQTGPDTFAGTVTMPGYPGGRQMQVSGTYSGQTGTFTITMPTPQMPMMGSCGGQVTGTFDLDTMRVQMHGAYSGSTTCFGPFGNGWMTMTKR